MNSFDVLKKYSQYAEVLNESELLNSWLCYYCKQKEMDESSFSVDLYRIIDTEVDMLLRRKIRYKHWYCIIPCCHECMEKWKWKKWKIKKLLIYIFLLIRIITVLHVCVWWQNFDDFGSLVTILYLWVLFVVLWFVVYILGFLLYSFIVNCMLRWSYKKYPILQLLLQNWWKRWYCP